MSTAIFDPNQVKGTARGTGNIVYLQNLWLDFEDGDLSPDEFPTLFPRTRMILTNTFRHTVARPRYRVIIPTTDQLMPEVYLLLYEQIARKLEDAGYAVPRRKPKAGRTSNAANRQSGLDWSKRLPTSLFYLPSQAADPSQSFFRDYSDTARAPLDPSPGYRMGRCRSNRNSAHVLISTMMEERSTKLAFKPPSAIGTAHQRDPAMKIFFSSRFSSEEPA